jgi:hypothetical protein
VKDRDKNSKDHRRDPYHVVSDYWVYHRECSQLIDLQIVLHWRFSDQLELLVSILVLVSDPRFSHFSYQIRSRWSSRGGQDRYQVDRIRSRGVEAIQIRSQV